MGRIRLDRLKTRPGSSRHRSNGDDARRRDFPRPRFRARPHGTPRECQESLRVLKVFRLKPKMMIECYRVRSYDIAAENQFGETDEQKPNLKTTLPRNRLRFPGTVGPT